MDVMERSKMLHIRVEWILFYSYIIIEICNLRLGLSKPIKEPKARLRHKAVPQDLLKWNDLIDITSTGHKITLNASNLYPSVLSIRSLSIFAARKLPQFGRFSQSWLAFFSIYKVC